MKWIIAVWDCQGQYNNVTYCQQLLEMLDNDLMINTYFQQFTGSLLCCDSCVNNYPDLGLHLHKEFKFHCQERLSHSVTT